MRQNPHVRICGGPGSATTLVYPTPCWGEMAGKVRAGRWVVHRFRDLVAHCRRLRTDLTHVSSSSIRIFNSEGCGNGVPSARASS